MTTPQTPGPSSDSPSTGTGQVESLVQEVLSIADVDTALIEAALAGSSPKRKRREKPPKYQPRHAYIYTSAS